MSSIVICEKPSQARNVISAIGNSYGDVIAAQGHLLRLRLPEEENPAWAKWSTVLLRPTSGRFGMTPDTAPGKSERLAKIRKALAHTDCVYIATDCDREGQSIGENILRYCDYSGRVMRVIFSAEDSQTISKAFANARPNEEFRPLYEAAVARQQADQIYNLSLTRALTASVNREKRGPVIGIGRVKTPTMGIICRRERQLREFVPRTYYVLSGTVRCACGIIKMEFKPDGEARLFDRAAAEQIVNQLRRNARGTFRVLRERRKSVPPKPFDLPALQVRAAAWGWTARRTLETAQALYETHKLITYPRAATRYLPEALMAEVPHIWNGLKAAGMAQAALWPDPILRQGRNGVFSNAGLNGEPHHAIIPNPALADNYQREIDLLVPDEQRLFVLICKAFLACTGPDQVYDRTHVEFAPVAGDQTIKFASTGIVRIDPGWKAVWDGEDVPSESGNGEGDGTALPPVSDGEVGRIESAEIISRTTIPPTRYNEGSLIQTMENAWKFINDPEEKLRLKNAKGLGTPATRDTIIEGLKAQGFLTVDKGRLVATEAAMQLYNLLQSSCPELVDPATTARMEMRLDGILRGEVTADDVIGEICESATRLIRIVSAGACSLVGVAFVPPRDAHTHSRHISASGRRRPAAGIRNRGEPVAPNAADQALRTASSGRSPSADQETLAKKIALRMGAEVPPAAAADARELSRWISEHNLATPKQTHWISKLVEEGRIQPPAGYPDRVSAFDANRVLDKAFARQRKRNGN